MDSEIKELIKRKIGFKWRVILVIVAFVFRYLPDGVSKWKKIITSTQPEHPIEDACTISFTFEPSTLIIDPTNSCTGTVTLINNTGSTYDIISTSNHNHNEVNCTLENTNSQFKEILLNHRIKPGEKSLLEINFCNFYDSNQFFGKKLVYFTPTCVADTSMKNTFSCIPKGESLEVNFTLLPSNFFEKKKILFIDGRESPQVEIMRKDFEELGMIFKSMGTIQRYNKYPLKKIAIYYNARSERNELALNFLEKYFKDNENLRNLEFIRYNIENEGAARYLKGFIQKYGLGDCLKEKNQNDQPICYKSELGFSKLKSGKVGEYNTFSPEIFSIRENRDIDLIVIITE